MGRGRDTELELDEVGNEASQPDRQGDCGREGSQVHGGAGEAGVGEGGGLS